MDEDKKMTSTWITNAKGVKSVWPRHVAEEKVRKNYGWEFAVPDEVPEQKQYPFGRGELTEAGLRRRKAAVESQDIANNQSPEEKEIALEAMTHADLKIKAKRLGVEKYWVMSKERLLREIKAQQGTA